jgi:hypothetical protein
MQSTWENFIKVGIIPSCSYGRYEALLALQTSLLFFTLIFIASSIENSSTLSLLPINATIEIHKDILGNTTTIEDEIVSTPSMSNGQFTFTDPSVGIIMADIQFSRYYYFPVVNHSH